MGFKPDRAENGHGHYAIYCYSYSNRFRLSVLSAREDIFNLLEAHNSMEQASAY